VAFAIAAVAAAAAWLYFWQARKGKMSRFADRDDLSLHQIYHSHFSETGVPEKRFVELWTELSRVLEIPAGKLRPSDRFDVELSPPKGFEFNDQINDVKYLIGKYCERTGASPTSIKTVSDYLIALGAR